MNPFDSSLLVTCLTVSHELFKQITVGLHCHTRAVVFGIVECPFEAHFCFDGWVPLMPRPRAGRLATVLLRETQVKLRRFRNRAFEVQFFLFGVICLRLDCLTD